MSRGACTPTRWSSSHHLLQGEQLVLSHIARPGDVAEAIQHAWCSKSLRSHMVVKLKPELQSSPAYVISKRVAWEWDMPEPEFLLMPGDRVLVIAFVCYVIDPPPPQWNGECMFPLVCVQPIGTSRIGWCKAWNVEVPLL